MPGCVRGNPQKRIKVVATLFALQKDARWAHASCLLFLLPPCSSLWITFRILQRELMENSSTIYSKDNLQREETLIRGHTTRAVAVPLMQPIDCFWQCRPVVLLVKEIYLSSQIKPHNILLAFMPTILCWIYWLQALLWELPGVESFCSSPSFEERFNIKYE